MKRSASMKWLAGFDPDHQIQSSGFPLRLSTRFFTMHFGWEMSVFCISLTILTELKPTAGASLFLLAGSGRSKGLRQLVELRADGCAARCRAAQRSVRAQV